MIAASVVVMRACGVVNQMAAETNDPSEAAQLCGAAIGATEVRFQAWREAMIAPIGGARLQCSGAARFTRLHLDRVSRLKRCDEIVSRFADYSEVITVASIVARACSVEKRAMTL